MKKLRLLGFALPLAAIVFVLFSLLAGATNAKMRWDIISLTGTTISAGGHASAFATTSGSPAHTGKITLTGNGTFRSNAGNPQDVTGGGTWKTFDASGNSTGSGNYKVTGFVDFDLAPGFLPPALTDTIADASTAHSGLAVLKIAYDDGSDGILVVSCDLPGGLNPNIFEGITATKGFVDYWDRAPAGDPTDNGGNANRTVFHEIQ
jgi:hypothetical protein